MVKIGSSLLSEDEVEKLKLIHNKLIHDNELDSDDENFLSEITNKRKYSEDNILTKSFWLGAEASKNKEIKEPYALLRKIMDSHIFYGRFGIILFGNDNTDKIVSDVDFTKLPEKVHLLAYEVTFKNCMFPERFNNADRESDFNLFSYKMKTAQFKDCIGVKLQRLREARAAAYLESPGGKGSQTLILKGMLNDSFDTKQTKKGKTIYKFKYNLYKINEKEFLKNIGEDWFTSEVLESLRKNIVDVETGEAIAPELLDKLLKNKKPLTGDQLSLGERVLKGNLEEQNKIKHLLKSFSTSEEEYHKLWNGVTNKLAKLPKAIKKIYGLGFSEKTLSDIKDDGSLHSLLDIIAKAYKSDGGIRYIPDIIEKHIGQKISDNLEFQIKHKINLDAKKGKILMKGLIKDMNEDDKKAIFKKLKDPRGNNLEEEFVLRYIKQAYGRYGLKSFGVIVEFIENLKKEGLLSKGSSLKVVDRTNEFDKKLVINKNGEQITLVKRVQRENPIGEFVISSKFFYSPNTIDGKFF